MNNIYFISDLHIGHNRVCEFAKEFRGYPSNVDEHDKWLVKQWNSVVTKDDLVYVLGDVCFDKNRLHILKKLNGSKHLILGNHDKMSLSKYNLYFNKVHGFQKFRGKAWMSHSPIHPNSLRGLFNIHGHVHQNTLNDLRYINVSVEALSGKPISWDTLEVMMEDRKCLMKLNNSHLMESNTTGA